MLDEPRLDEVLARAAGRNEDEVKRLVAALRPRPAVPDSVRRMRVRAAVGADAAAGAAAAAGADAAAPEHAPMETQTCSPAADAPPRAWVVPLSATQHLLKATVSEEFVRDLEEVRAALGHKLPGGSLEAVLHECLRVTLAACHKRRRGAGRARPAAASDRATVTAAANDNLDGAPVTAAVNDPLHGAPVSAAANHPLHGAPRPVPANLDAPARPPSRYIPAAVRDEVWRRDGGRCTFVGTGGHVCGSSFQIELHHLQAFARGGAATVAGLALRCRAHNLHEAERDFGRQQVERAIGRVRHERGSRQARLF